MAAGGRLSAVRVTVRFFASLRESAGRDSLTLTLSRASLAGVKARLAERLSAAQFAAISAEGVRIAVNQAIAQGDVALATGDEIAFLPPVTGG